MLKVRLQGIMEWDEHLGEDRTYNIRSIYFDDYDDSCMYENEAGANERMKFRIRIYDGASSFIRLEAKYKKNGMTKKRSARISLDLCRKIMEGEMLEMEDCGGDPLLQLLYINMRTRLFRPKVIVEYDRTVFISPVGNVRITFDRNIRASQYIERFFEENLYAVPVLETGQHVLEIKYDELLPDYIAQVLEFGRLEQTAFSKYYLSRQKIGDM